MSRAACAFAASLVFAGLSAGCAHRPATPPPPSVIRYATRGWLLEERTDPFTQVTTCRLVDRLGWNPDAAAAPAVFTFRFGHGRDTSDAWYRIGAGPPHPWRDLTSELIAAGALGQAERLDNPSDGAALIPIDVLSGADTITIRPAKDVAPKRFDLRGAWPLLAASKPGCRFSDW